VQSFTYCPHTLADNNEHIWIRDKTLAFSSTMLSIIYAHTHTRLTALFSGLPRWAGTRMVKPIWILLKQETVSGSGISWAVCKSAPCFRHITTPASHNSVFYRPDALPATQVTASKHWRDFIYHLCINIKSSKKIYSKNTWHKFTSSFTDWPIT